MKLIKIKRHNSVQIAHLYGNIVYSRINELFYIDGLCPFVDYTLVRHDFSQGIIHLDLELHTEQAIELADEILTLDINVEHKILIQSLSQLIAQNEQPLNSIRYRAMKVELEKIHAQPWQDIDDAKLTDAANTPMVPGSLYVIEGDSFPATKLTTTVLISPDFAAQHRQLLPLFRQCALLVANSFTFDLNDFLGYYSEKLEYICTDQTISLSNSFKVAYDDEADPDNVLRICRETLEYFHERDVFVRLTTELCSASSPHHALEATDARMTTRDWEKIATDKNCELILQHMSIEVKYEGRQVQAPLFFENQKPSNHDDTHKTA